MDLNNKFCKIEISRDSLMLSEIDASVKLEEDRSRNLCHGIRKINKPD